MHMFDDFKNQPVSCLEFLLYVLHVSEVFRKIFSKAYSMWIVFKIRPLIYKCSATSQAKTTPLWRQAQKTKVAGRRVCHKPAIWLKTAEKEKSTNYLNKQTRDVMKPKNIHISRMRILCLPFIK